MRRRIAYTLVELLVVLAILTILIALIFPAVQKVRSSANLLICSGKMRSVSLAAIAYNDIHDRLPQSFQQNYVPRGYYHLSWLARLLPLLGEENSWQEIEADYHINSIPFRNPVHRSIDRLVPQFHCPSDPVSHNVWQIGSGGRNPTKVAFTSYLGSIGTSWRDQTGVIVQHPKISLNHVTDGSSQTLLLVERVPSFDRRFGWWYSAQGQKGTGSLDFVIGVRELNGLAEKYPFYRKCPPGPYGFRLWDISDPCSLFSIGGNHNTLSNFAMLDGSVKTLTIHADTIMIALSTRAANDLISIND